MVKSRKGLANRIWFILLLAVLLSSGLICVVSFLQAREAIIQATRQRMLDMANCASGSVNGDDLKDIQKEDEGSDKYQKIFDALAVYRDNIESKYVYAIRDEGDGTFTFTIDPSEPPAEFGALVYKTDALVMASRGTATVDEEPYTDEWGTFYSAYSPVFDSKGEVAGVVAVDFTRQWVEGQQKEQITKLIIMYVVIMTCSLITVGIFAFFNVRAITIPMKRITEAAEQYEKGDYSKRLELDRKDEVGVLSRSLQSMASSLTERIEDAEAANKAKDDFLANMSHELRTPINSILGLNEMILKESSEKEIRDYSRNIQKSGSQLIELVDDILNASKVLKVSEEKEKGNELKIVFTAPNARILVVDDNPMNLMVFKNLVKHTEVTVDTAGSGDEGISLTENNYYDLIVLDHMMPDKDGIETLEEIRSDKTNLNMTTPVVCLTANAIAGAREKYIEAGFDDYLTKPVSTSDLEKIMIKYIPEDKINKTEIFVEETMEENEDIPEVLRSLSGSVINVETGLKNSGNLDSYLALLRVYYESIDDKYNELNSYYNNEDYENYTIKVHALKSSSRIIGAADFGEKAQALENAGKAGDIAYISSKHENFMEEYKGFKDIIEPIFNAMAADDDKPEADEDLMQSVFEEIYTAADELDCDMLESIFTEMDSYRIPESYADLYNKLKGAASMYEYDTVMELIDSNK